MTEVHRVRELAKLVSEMTGAPVEHVDNPRNEVEENQLYVENQRFLELGLQPVTLQEGLMREISEIAEKYRDRVDYDKIPCRSRWRTGPLS